MKFSFIISTYRSDFLTKYTVNTILKNYFISEYEIIIITNIEKNDNLITDPSITYVYRQEYKGDISSLNYGIQVATGEYCIFLDSGIVPTDKYFLELMNLNLNSDIYIGLSKNFSFEKKTNSINQYVYEAEILKKNLSNDYREKYYDKYGENLVYWRAPWALFWKNNIIVKREVLEKFGYFDEWFEKSGGEGIELGIRLFYSGCTFSYNKNLEAIYIPCETTQKLSRNIMKITQYDKIYKYILQKHNYFSVKKWGSTCLHELEHTLIACNNLIVSDFDGTLVTTSGTIPLDIMEKIDALNFQFILATGRSYSYFQNLKLPFEGVFANGAQIVKNGKITEIGIEIETCLDIISYLTSINVPFTCHTSSKIIINKEFNFDNKMIELAKLHSNDQNEIDEGSKIYKRIIYDNSLKVESVSDYIRYASESILKFELFITKDKRNVMSQLSNMFNVNCVSSHISNIEIVNTRVNKGEGIKAYIGNSNYNIIAIGDGDNDIDMFDIANYSYAMGNSTDKLKSIATKVVSNVEDDGFIEVLKILEESYV